MILNFDRPDAPELRGEHRDEHLRYVDGFMHQILASGALTDEDDVTFGGFVLLDVEDRSAALRFSELDPFTRSGLFERVVVAKWRRGIYNFERL
jgi:uncharacterized protein YciI